MQLWNAAAWRKMTKYQVFWTRTAQLDLKGILEYIATGSTAHAKTILNEIRQKTAGLSNLLLRGRVVPELKYHGIPDYREIIRHPWRIIYKVEENKVWILAVVDSRRNVEDLLLVRLVDRE